MKNMQSKVFVIGLLAMLAIFASYCLKENKPQPQLQSEVQVQQDQNPTAMQPAPAIEQDTTKIVIGGTASYDPDRQLSLPATNTPAMDEAMKVRAAEVVRLARESHGQQIVSK
jgi:hypothetical protein